MPTFFDPAYIAAARSVQTPDYLSMFSNAYNTFSEMPWSARKQRERSIQDYQLMMQQQRFQAEMADRAHNAKIQDLLLPYKIQQAQAMAARYAQPAGDSVVNKVQNWFQQPASAPQSGPINLDGTPTVLDSPEMSPLPEDGIPDPLPVMPQGRVSPDLNYTPDSPVF